MQPKHSVECGFYRVQEAKIFHYAGYECAAWWKDIRVEAGDYPVSAIPRHGGGLDFVVDLPGIIVADNFQSLWGGMPIGKSYDATQNAGKPDSYIIHSQDYVVFGAMREESSNWKVDVSKLPIELARCADCSGYIRANRSVDICPSCSVARTDKLKKYVRSRHRFLLATAYGLGVSRQSSYLDSVMAEAKQKGNMQGFYAELLQKEVAAMRAAGPIARVKARSQRPLPQYAFPH